MHMMLTLEPDQKKKKLLEESYVMLERLKKLRALNGNPRFVGINPRLERAFARHKETNA
jgi:hypothetical protein